MPLRTSLSDFRFRWPPTASEASGVCLSPVTAVHQLSATAALIFRPEYMVRSRVPAKRLFHLRATCNPFSSPSCPSPAFVPFLSAAPRSLSQVFSSSSHSSTFWTSVSFLAFQGSLFVPGGMNGDCSLSHNSSNWCHLKKKSPDPG